MKDELFQQLAASLKEGGAILRGDLSPYSSASSQTKDDITTLDVVAQFSIIIMAV
jgi:hypothetical protein